MKSTSHNSADSQTQRNKRSGQVRSRETTVKPVQRVTRATVPGSHVHLLPMDVAKEVKSYLAFCRTHGIKSTPMGMSTWCKLFEPEMYRGLLDKCRAKKICHQRSCRAVWATANVIIPGDYRASVFMPYGSRALEDKLRNAVGQPTDDRRRLDWGEMPSEFMNPLRPRKGRKNGFRFGRARYNAHLHALLQGPGPDARADRFVRVIQPQYRKMTYRDLCLRLADRYMISGLREAIEKRGKLLFGDYLDAVIGDRPSADRERKIQLRAARRKEKKTREEFKMMALPTKMNEQQMQKYISQLINDFHKLHPDWPVRRLDPFWSSLTSLFKTFSHKHPQYRSLCRILSNRRKRTVELPRPPQDSKELKNGPPNKPLPPIPSRPNKPLPPIPHRPNKPLPPLPQPRRPPPTRPRSQSLSHVEEDLTDGLRLLNRVIGAVNKRIAQDVAPGISTVERSPKDAPRLPKFLARQYNLPFRVQTKYRSFTEAVRARKRMEQMNRRRQRLLEVKNRVEKVRAEIGKIVKTGLDGGLHDDFREWFLGVDPATGEPWSGQSDEDDVSVPPAEETETKETDKDKDLLVDYDELRKEHTMEELHEMLLELEAMEPISDLPTDDSYTSSDEEDSAPVSYTDLDKAIEPSSSASQPEFETNVVIQQLQRTNQRLRDILKTVAPFYNPGLLGGSEKADAMIYYDDDDDGAKDDDDADDNGEDDKNDEESSDGDEDDSGDDDDSSESGDDSDEEKEWRPHTNNYVKDPHNESTDFLHLDYTIEYGVLKYTMILGAVAAATKFISRKFALAFIPLVCGLPSYRFFTEHYGTYKPVEKETKEVRKGKAIKKITSTYQKDVRYLKVSPVNMDLVIGKIHTETGFYSPFLGWTITLTRHEDLYNDTIVRGYAHDTKGPMSDDDKKAYYHRRKNTVNQNVADVTYLQKATIRAMRVLDYIRGLPVRVPLFAALVGLSSAQLTGLSTKEIKPDFKVTTFDVDVHTPSCWYSLLPYNEIQVLDYAPVVLDRFEQQNMVLGAINRIGVDNAMNIDLFPYLELINDTIDELFKGMEEMEEPLDIYGINKWIESRPYPAAAKKKLKECADELRMIGLEKHKVEQLKEWRTEAFIKNEAYPERKFARLICAGGSVRKLIYGPIFEKLNDFFFAQDWSLKKVPIYERAARLTDIFPDVGHFYVTDHSAFECSATAQVQDAIEKQVYLRFVREEHVPYLQYILEGYEGKGIQRIYSHLGVLIETPVVRNSGEMNTSLGNSILNAITAHVAFKSNGAKILQFVVEGDDALILSDKYIPPEKIAQVMSNLGCRIKIEYYQNLNETSFCSTFITDEGPTINWERNLIKIPWKDTLVLKNHRQEMVDKIGSMVMYSTASAISRALTQYYHPTRAKFKNDSYVRENLAMSVEEEDQSIVTNIPRHILRELYKPINIEHIMNDHLTSGVSMNTIDHVVTLILRGRLTEAINAFYEELDDGDRRMMTEQIQSFNPGTDNIHLLGRYFVAGQPGQNHHNKF